MPASTPNGGSLAEAVGRRGRRRSVYRHRLARRAETVAGAYPAARYARAMRGSVTVHMAAHAADAPVLDGRRFRPRPHQHERHAGHPGEDEGSRRNRRPFPLDRSWNSGRRCTSAERRVRTRPRRPPPVTHRNQSNAASARTERWIADSALKSIWFPWPSVPCRSSGSVGCGRSAEHFGWHDHGCLEIGEGPVGETVLLWLWLSLLKAVPGSMPRTRHLQRCLSAGGPGPFGGDVVIVAGPDFDGAVVVGQGTGIVRGIVSPAAPGYRVARPLPLPE